MSIKAILVLSCAALAHAAVVPFEMAGPGPGSIQVSPAADSVSVAWKDKAGRPCSAVFSLDPATPLIRSIDVNGRTVVSRAAPVYRASTGKRRGGWDQFFDFPRQPSGRHTQFPRRFQTDGGACETSKATGSTSAFDGLTLGIFHGSVHYFFFPGSTLIQQRAIVSTNEPDTAFYYDAGIRMAVDEDRRSGFTMETKVNYYDTAGKLQTVKSPHASEWHPVAVRYRALSTATGAGSIAVFPPPHRYFMARDYTSNMGYLWYRLAGQCLVGDPAASRR